MQRPNGLVAASNIPPCKIKAIEGPQSMSSAVEDERQHESRESAIIAHTVLLKKLKADLCREEAQLILLQKLRASQRIDNSKSLGGPRPTNHHHEAVVNRTAGVPSGRAFQARPCRGKPCTNAIRAVPSTNHVSGGSKVSRVKESTPSYHPSFMFHHQQAIDTPAAAAAFPNISTSSDRHWSGHKTSQNHQRQPHQVASGFTQGPRPAAAAYAAHTHNHNDPAQRQAMKRQNLRKSVDKFLFSVRSYRNRLASSFLPTAPINFLPSPISHDFTMLLGLEEICRFVQKRISHGQLVESEDPPVEEKPKGISKCALCGSHCSPLFFRLNTAEDKSVVQCTVCVRSMRFRQLESEQLDRLRQVYASDKLSPPSESSKACPLKQHDSSDVAPFCSLNNEQLRMCQAQWMRQARLLSPSSNVPFSGTHFLSPAVAAAAAIAAMTATHHTTTSGMHMPFQTPHIPAVLPTENAQQEDQPVALNLAVKYSPDQSSSHRHVRAPTKVQTQLVGKEELLSPHFHK